MTRNEIKRIKGIAARPQELRTEFYRALRDAEGAVRRIQAEECDHRTPEGKTAFAAGGMCGICGLSLRVTRVKVY
jgi:hypothetical protein